MTLINPTPQRARPGTAIKPLRQLTRPANSLLDRDDLLMLYNAVLPQLMQDRPPILIVTSAVHGGVRLIGVVLGAASNPERDAHMTALLDQGFEELDVPPERRTVVAGRLPSLVGTAHAATLTLQPARARAAAMSAWAIQVGSFSTERAASLPFTSTLRFFAVSAAGPVN